MVKAVMDGVTTLYVSPVYQVKGSVVTKYYVAGGQVVAIRTGSTLSYLISDHIGSNSVTVSDTGTKTAETRYKAWGEVRYQSGTNPSDRTYTGQRSYASDFGLMYYNARWYDSYLNHFTQPDSIIPGGVQGYDRYAYANNNPVRYNDPSGHCSVSGHWMPDDNLACKSSGAVQDLTSATMESTLQEYGVALNGNWGGEKAFNRIFGAYAATILIASRLASETNGVTPLNAFKAAYAGGVNITFGTYNPETDTKGQPTGYDYNHPDMSLDACKFDQSGGCTSSPTQIDFWNMAGDNGAVMGDTYNAVHELGHAYSYGHGIRAEDSLSRIALLPPPFQMHPPSMNKNNAEVQGELYGDSFVAWTFNAWNTSTDPDIAAAVDQAKDFMP